MAAGPAWRVADDAALISVPSMAMLRRSFPRRVLTAVALAVVVCGVISGLLAVALGLKHERIAAFALTWLVGCRPAYFGTHSVALIVVSGVVAGWV